MMLFYCFIIAQEQRHKNTIICSLPKLDKIWRSCLTPPKQNIRSPYFTSFINNLPVLSYDKAKYLGVFVDSRLNFNSRIKSVENKIARSVGILSKLKHSLSSTSLLKLYYAFIHPHMLYGLSIWGSTHKSYLSKLQTPKKQSCKNHWRRKIYGPCYTILLETKIPKKF